MGTYSKKQLTEIVKGAFKCSPNEAAFYGASNGTFLNQQQYDKVLKLDKENKTNNAEAYEKFENPALSKDDDADDKAEAKAQAKAEADAKKAAEAEAKAQAKAEADAKKAAAKAGAGK